MRRILQSFLVLLFAAGMLFASAGCEQLGLTKKKDDNSGLMLLLGLAAANSGSGNSGFFVTIPAGVAK